MNTVVHDWTGGRPVTTQAFIADRAGMVSPAAFDPGSGWAIGAGVFADQDKFQFLVMCAPTADRVALRAPIIMLCADEETLFTALGECCAALCGKACEWQCFVGDVALRERIAARLSLEVEHGHAH
jgi:hypothetical protein